MPYRSGTFDDLLAIRQRQRRQRRRIAEANTPSGSQPYQTTLKVRNLDLDLKTIEDKATLAQQTADEAKSTAEQSLASSVKNSRAITLIQSDVTVIKSNLPTPATEEQIDSLFRTTKAKG